MQASLSVQILIGDLIDAAGFVRRGGLGEDGSVGFLHRCFDFGLLIDIYLDDSHR